MADETPATVTVTDRRTPPRGVLPRSAQTWLMAGLALGILGIILITGSPEAPERSVAAPPLAAPTPSPDRLRDYQDRLRLLDERSRQQAVAPPSDSTPPLLYEPPDSRAASVDPLAAEKQRRDYESLFASNLVSSRRVGSERRGANALADLARVPGAIDRDPLTPPTLDDVAEAVIRATARTPGASVSSTAAETPAGVSAPVSMAARDPGRSTPRATAPIEATGPRHRLLEGTIIDAVLTNRLDGGSASPVNALVTNPVYSHGGQHIVIPAGARVLGETKPVQAFGETRLAVAFHRVLFPDGGTHALDQFAGVNQVGDLGLRDRVNQHYWSTFGASAAVGLVTGLSQFVGSAGLGAGTGNRTVVIAGGVGNATSQATAQVMDRFLNRMPTITIREGHRLKVYLTSDLELPAYEPERSGLRP